MKRQVAARFQKGLFLFGFLLVLTCGTEDDFTEDFAAPGISRAGGSVVRLAWDPNTEPNLAGYWLYQSRIPGRYTKSKRVLKTPAGIETCTVGPLPPGKYFWVLTAFDSSLNESGYSNEVSARID